MTNARSGYALRDGRKASPNVNEGLSLPSMDTILQ